MSVNDLAARAYSLLCIQLSMDFDFDPEKARLNPINHHGVTFEEASAVLLDPFALTRIDADTINESRYITLGMGGTARILVVVWTERTERIRIISAWKASNPQRRIYEAQF